MFLLWPLDDEDKKNPAVLHSKQILLDGSIRIVFCVAYYFILFSFAFDGLISKHRLCADNFRLIYRNLWIAKDSEPLS